VILGTGSGKRVVRLEARHRGTKTVQDVQVRPQRVVVHRQLPQQRPGQCHCHSLEALCTTMRYTNQLSLIRGTVHNYALHKSTVTH